MSRCEISIGFQGLRVVVHSALPEVTVALRQSFREMLAPPTAPIVGRVSVDRGGFVSLNPRGLEPSMCGNSLVDVLRLTQYSVARHLVEATPALMWLHAAAASRDGGAVLLCGASGRGKSALVTELCARGWRYLTDELAPLDTASRQVFPFPQAPTPRDEAEAELPGNELDRLAKTEIGLDQAVVGREASPVVVVIFPVYSRGASTTLQRCTRVDAAAQLLQNCVNFTHHGACAIRYVCRLVESIPAFQLTYGSRALAADSIHRLSDDGWELRA